MKLIFLSLFSFSLLFSKTFVYECQDNKHFVIKIDNAEAWLFTKEISTSLVRVASASGQKYEKEGVRFFSEGYEAMLDTPNEHYKMCMNNRYKAIWEDAKLRGNDFRASGNEPGWYLEIAERGKKTLLVTDYGKEKYELVLPRPYSSHNNRTLRYRIQGFLDILIENKTCSDSMTGHRLESSVHVNILGKSYKGCGKYLH